ncbi:unnamed protein product [Moneuplotes crassus]|uniref:Uncharacterized protein n=1 Tax=Euplotes crassus TaxID=5936 RepID=A0AAD1UFM0_EUPCR|nr:unnamed protein product [Moneuplotes crassus]
MKLQRYPSNKYSSTTSQKRNFRGKDYYLSAIRKKFGKKTSNQTESSSHRFNFSLQASEDIFSNRKSLENFSLKTEEFLKSTHQKENERGIMKLRNSYLNELKKIAERYLIINKLDLEDPEILDAPSITQSYSTKISHPKIYKPGLGFKDLKKSQKSSFVFLRNNSKTPKLDENTNLLNHRPYKNTPLLRKSQDKPAGVESRIYECRASVDLHSKNVISALRSLLAYIFK